MMEGKNPHKTKKITKLNKDSEEEPKRLASGALLHTEGWTASFGNPI